jgi:glutathione S-transferase
MGTQPEARTLELISHAMCPFVHRAAALLTEKQVPFTQRIVDLEAKPAWFLAISPRGKVPVLITNGVPIFESAVIVEYLDETSAPHMMPSDPLERAHQRMWAEISNDLLAGHHKIVVAPTPAERAAAISATRETMQRFEQAIVGPCFTGDQLSIVDVAAGPALLRLERMGHVLGIEVYADLPRMAAWSHQLTERPAFRDTLVPDFDARYRALVVQHPPAA